MQQGWEPIEVPVLPELRAIPLERICAIFDVDPSLMRPYSTVADAQAGYYRDVIQKSLAVLFERQLERHLILGVDAAVKEPDRTIILPSFDEVADKAEERWTNRQRPKSTMRPKQSKARRKMAQASRKRNRGG